MIEAIDRSGEKHTRSPWLSPEIGITLSNADSVDPSSSRLQRKIDRESIDTQDFDSRT
jgi:hypothetical protein